MITLTWEEWVKQYRPIKNTIEPTDTYDGYMFETYGKEYEHVEAVLHEHPDRIWTLVEGDGSILIEEGWHYINRLGYFITEVGYPEGIQFVVDEDIMEDEEVSDD